VALVVVTCTVVSPARRRSTTERPCSTNLAVRESRTEAPIESNFDVHEGRSCRYRRVVPRTVDDARMTAEEGSVRIPN